MFNFIEISWKFWLFLAIYLGGEGKALRRWDWGKLSDQIIKENHQRMDIHLTWNNFGPWKAKWKVKNWRKPITENPKWTKWMDFSCDYSSIVIMVKTLGKLLSLFFSLTNERRTKYYSHLPTMSNQTQIINTDKTKTHNKKKPNDEVKSKVFNGKRFENPCEFHGYFLCNSLHSIFMKAYLIYGANIKFGLFQVLFHLSTSAKQLEKNVSLRLFLLLIRFSFLLIHCECNQHNNINKTIN